VTQVTLKDIQTPKSLTNDTSQLAKQVVSVSGTVVGIYTTSAGARQGFYIQDKAGAWNGGYVYYGTTAIGTSGTCVIGDSVLVTGTVTEYNGLTEIATVTACTTLATGKSYVINDVTTSDSQTEKWESCIVRINNATCGSSPSAGNFLVNDGSGTPDLDVYKQLFPTLALTTGTKYSIIGIITWYKSKTGAMFEIYPRSADDITISTGLSSIVANKLNVSLVGNVLSISEVANGSIVDVYSTDGAKVLSAQLVNGSVQLNNLSKGVYIVRVGNLTSKILL
jgi:hypothetical protein